MNWTLLFGLIQEMQLQSKIVSDNGKEGVLNLSVDWGDRLTPSPNVVTSHSDGTVSLYDVDTGAAKIVSEWNAHGYEAWIAAFNCHSPHLVMTGGDDCLFKAWDLRQDFTTAALVSKHHDAGVTTVSVHPHREHLLLTGSYDENIRGWDTRSMKSPIDQVATGGGVWRLKWNPHDPTLIAAACMYNGFHIYQFVNSSQTKGGFVHRQAYLKHASIAYGVDWALDKPNLVGTCSFYDHLFHLWHYA